MTGTQIGSSTPSQVNADWNASSGSSQILNKPTIPASQVNSDWNAASGVSQILNKPTIPTAQIQSDWNQTNVSSLDYIKNKPTLTTGTVTNVGFTSTDLSVSGSPITSSGTITANLVTVGTPGTYSGVTTDSKGRVTAGTVRSFNNAPGRSIVTGTGATGFQVSATRDAHVSASVGIVTTASIGSGQDAYIVMEIAPTNSATPSDWVEIGRVRNGQTYTLAVALQGVQTIAGDLSRIVPAGYYVKYRSVNVTGTPTTSWISGQEVIL